MPDVTEARAKERIAEIQQERERFISAANHQVAAIDLLIANYRQLFGLEPTPVVLPEPKGEA